LQLPPTAEFVVHSGGDKLDVAIAGADAYCRCRSKRPGLIGQTDIVIFGARRPIASERPFDTDTGGPAGIVARTREANWNATGSRSIGRICSDPRAAALGVQQHAIPRVAELTGQRLLMVALPKVTPPGLVTKFTVFLVLGAQSNMASAPMTTPPQNS